VYDRLHVSGSASTIVGETWLFVLVNEQVLAHTLSTEIVPQSLAVHTNLKI
jgi:hypothetical protein